MNNNLWDGSEDSNETFISQLSDALSLDPTKRCRSWTTPGSALSRAMINGWVGNTPSLGERAMFGGGTPFSGYTQHLLDSALAPRSEFSYHDDDDTA